MKINIAPRQQSDLLVMGSSLAAKHGEARPYSSEEGRVCDYLQRICPGVGCGDDPIGFLIASHESVCEELREMANPLRQVWE
jgi:hypothetical protein